MIVAFVKIAILEECERNYKWNKQNTITKREYIACYKTIHNFIPVNKSSTYISGPQTTQK